MKQRTMASLSRQTNRLPAPPARALIGLALALAALLLASCAGNQRKPVYRVHGKVIVDGKPAAGATVFFYPMEPAPDAIAPYGVTDADGSFALTTYTTFDGAPAGEYIITIRWPGPPKQSDQEQGPDRLQGRFDNPKTSPLRATVEKKANALLPFQVSTK